MAKRKPEVRWSPEALEDLGAIWNYYAKVAGPNTAEKIILEIVQVCGALASHPFGGRSRDEVRPSLRSLVAGTHVVFYVVQEGRPTMVRVLDARQDIDSQFSQTD